MTKTMTNMFQLSQSELHAFKHWAASLDPLPGRAASYSFTFTPGAIGVTVVATRVGDGASVDLTDYTKW